MVFPPKRRFSQNFLRDPRVVEKILAAAELAPADRVLEIGPGRGVLTRRLAAVCREVRVIEIDRELAAELRDGKDAGFHVHEGDALKMDWEDLLRTPPWKLVANLPYNISSPLFFKILEHRAFFERLVLMFQKEFAERLNALPGSKDYGIPSVFCRQYFEVFPVAVVPPASFYPEPKVFSMVLGLIPLAAPRVPVADEKLFFRVVRGAFAQRRKTLVNSLKGAGFPADLAAQKIGGAGIDPKRRGETLSLEEFADLTAVFAADPC